MNPPVVLSVAGTDSGGAAGIAADLTTFAALGVHGACVVAAVTAQDTLGVRAVHQVPLDVVAAQLDAVLDDLDPAVVKTGMLGSADVVRLVARRCAGRTIVVDPVVVATSGALLATPEVVAAYREHLLPVATVATPNAQEDEVFAPWPEIAVVRTGSGGDDVLRRPGLAPARFPHAQVATANDHGTGCTHSAALAAHLAHGLDLPDAVAAAARFVVERLRLGADWTLGRGRGPVAHLLTPCDPTPSDPTSSDPAPSDPTPSEQNPSTTPGDAA